MTQPDRSGADHPSTGAAQGTAENTAPTRSKVAGALAALACGACCALPPLIAAGIITGAGAAVAQQALLGAAAALATAGLGMWWLHRRSARSSHSGCACGGPQGCS